MNRKLIIFDFDGTLADTLPLFLQLLDQAADKYGFKRMDRSRQQALRHLDARQMMALHGVPLWKVPAIAHFMRSGLARRLEEVGLFPGMDDVLRELKARGVTLTIVSSNSRSNVIRILGPQLAALFSHFACGAALFGKLPKIRKVLDATAIPREQAILIGDEIRDARVAAEAGMDFGAVVWGYNHVDALLNERPAQVFYKVGQLLSGIAPLRPESP